MWYPQRTASLLALLGFAVVGCNQNPYVVSQVPATVQPQQPYLAEMRDLDQRAAALDADNRDLHTELAKSQQRVKLLHDEVGLLRQQLADTADQLRDVKIARDEVNREFGALQASNKRTAGATITANNSLRPKLTKVELTGIEVRQDEDLIRIELPADRLFQQGSGQLLPTAYAMLDEVAAALIRNYSKQMIGIEGHTDSVPSGAASNHQLASVQALSVFEVLTQRGQIPTRQLFTIGYGDNHPRVSNATPSGRARNRRIEIVVYPETVSSQ